MTIFNLFIFNPQGECIHYSEWRRDKKPSMSMEQECKLLYGLLFSIRSFVSKLSPTECRQGFQNYQTSRYKLNYFETATGVKFVLNTDRRAGGIQDLLRQIYSKAYVEYVVKNPVLTPGDAINSELFKNKLNELVRTHAAFGA